MGSLIVPSHIAKKRTAEIAAQQPRGKGLGPAFHEVDPKQKIYDQVGMKVLGELPGYTVHANRVLVAIYERPEAMRVGNTDKKIYLSDQTRREDEHQSKSALVLLLGHSAFKSDANFDFGPDRCDPGDWVAVFVHQGRKIVIHGQLCRIVYDQDIEGKIPGPDSIY